ncbi:hypothetical protein FH609_007475 [Streptomyces sp. 3MP-14]|uniref:Uncharacterized protein n=1 Tax=Streptomyces mimosae TaxID=2586635 RepID=A0A5N6AKM0_9ACTN|nr:MULTISPECIES: hypothetical protein [Streptomyces]KAB8168755.1 hypothetical protein FH607_005890 [Streptomyces mimosae]KAB8177965.1 hypothetical protein FH609_007475 [Streptomyces sp. 3MP-14]
MSDWTCGQCGSREREPGFLEDLGQGAKGYTRWIAGALDRGVFGGARLMGRQRWVVEAWRCRGCGRLDLYAREPA